MALQCGVRGEEDETEVVSSACNEHGVEERDGESGALEDQKEEL